MTESLDDLDRGLLQSIVRHPEAPYTQWAEENETSATTAARRFDHLTRIGAVRVIGRTLPGFDGAVAWLARIFGSPEPLGLLSTELSALQTTRWVRLSRDRGELFCGIVAAPEAADDLLQRLRSTVPHRDLRLHHMLQVWGLPADAEQAPGQLDAIDRALLEIYAEDGRASAANVASHLSLDPATVTRRRHRLIDAGILFFEADVHPDIFSETGNFNVWLRVEPGMIAELGSELVRREQTQYVAAVSGAEQMFANIALPRPQDVIGFLDSLGDRGIVGLEIVPMGRTLKRSPG